MVIKKKPELDHKKKIALYDTLTSDINLAWGVNELARRLGANEEQVRRELYSLRRADFVIIKQVGGEIYARALPKFVREWGCGSS